MATHTYHIDSAPPGNSQQDTRKARGKKAKSRPPPAIKQSIPTGTSILQWNVNSVFERKAELMEILASTQPHVVCLQESKLKPTDKLYIPGYNIVRKDRTHKGGGGVLTAIKTGMPYTSIDIDCKDALCIQIKMENNYVYITNLYVPPKSDYPTEEIRKHLITHHSMKHILLGDMNAYSPISGADRTNKYGKEIERIVNEVNLDALNRGVVTHLTAKGDKIPILTSH